jgi:hypothetical protein
MDSLSVPDFVFDAKIRTIKAEKPDGSLQGMPFFELADGAQAVNYSTVDPTCTGYTAFENLTLASVQSYTLQSDDASFDLSTCTSGTTGQPLLADVQAEYAKLVIGDQWKSPANNSVVDDEPIWIISTVDGYTVKMIVTDFPADPAPTATGYIEIAWDILQ